MRLGVGPRLREDRSWWCSIDAAPAALVLAGRGAYKLRPGDRNDEESFEVRKGKVGGYVEYLSADEIESLDRKMAETLSDFYGYKPCVPSMRTPD